eukprot:Rmarinus@m.24757
MALGNFASQQILSVLDHSLEEVNKLQYVTDDVLLAIERTPNFSREFLKLVYNQRKLESKYLTLKTEGKLETEEGHDVIVDFEDSIRRVLRYMLNDRAVSAKVEALAADLGTSVGTGRVAYWLTAMRGLLEKRLFETVEEMKRRRELSMNVQEKEKKVSGMMKELKKEVQELRNNHNKSILEKDKRLSKIRAELTGISKEAEHERSKVVRETNEINSKNSALHEKKRLTLEQTHEGLLKQLAEISVDDSSNEQHLMKRRVKAEEDLQAIISQYDETMDALYTETKTMKALYEEEKKKIEAYEEHYKKETYEKESSRAWEEKRLMLEKEIDLARQRRKLAEEQKLGEDEGWMILSNVAKEISDTLNEQDTIRKAYDMALGGGLPGPDTVHFIQTYLKCTPMHDTQILQVVRGLKTGPVMSDEDKAFLKEVRGDVKNIKEEWRLLSGVLEEKRGMLLQFLDVFGQVRMERVPQTPATPAADSDLAGKMRKASEMLAQGDEPPAPKEEAKQVLFLKDFLRFAAYAKIRGTVVSVNQLDGTFRRSNWSRAGSVRAGDQDTYLQDWEFVVALVRLAYSLYNGVSGIHNRVKRFFEEYLIKIDINNVAQVASPSQESPELKDLFERFEENLKRLFANYAARDKGTRKGPIHELNFYQKNGDEMNLWELIQLLQDAQYFNETRTSETVRERFVAITLDTTADAADPASHSGVTFSELNDLIVLLSELYFEETGKDGRAAVCVEDFLQNVILGESVYT